MVQNNTCIGDPFCHMHVQRAFTFEQIDWLIKVMSPKLIHQIPLTFQRPNIAPYSDEVAAMTITATICSSNIATMVINANSWKWLLICIA